MDALQSPLFIASGLLIVLHQLLQYVLGIHMSFADNYLDNLCAMPIILTLLLAERQLLFKKGRMYYLSLSEIVTTTIYISILSELIFPHLSSRFTYDTLDFVFFFAGSALYAFTESYRRKKRTIDGLENQNI